MKNETACFGERAPVKRLPSPVLLAALLLTTAASVGLCEVKALATNGRNIYRLAKGNLSGKPGEQQIIGSGYDGRVCAFAWGQAGLRSVWDATTGGFAFSVAAGDLDRDSRDEVFAGCADGKVYAFSGEGKPLWQVDFEAPVYQVAVVKTKQRTFLLAGTVNGQLAILSAAGVVEKTMQLQGAIRALTPGDYDGDGDQELFVAGFARDDFSFCQFLRLPDWTPFSAPWGQPMLLGAISRDDHGLNACAADLFGEGKDALVYQEGVLMPEKGPKLLASLPKPGPDTMYANAYRMRIPSAGDFLPSRPGREVVIVFGDEIGVYSVPAAIAEAKPIEAEESKRLDLEKAGKKKLKAIKAEQGEASRGEGKDAGDTAASAERVAYARSPISFNDALTVSANGRDALLLASAPNGDDNLYLVTIDRDGAWTRDIASLTWQGRIRQINDQIAELDKAIAGWSGQPAKGQDGPYVIMTERHPKLGRLGDLESEMRWVAETNRYYRERFPYPDRLRFAVEVEINEQLPGESGKYSGGFSRQDIIEKIIKAWEREDIPWVARIGHGGQAFVSAATVEAMIQAAPTTCIGFSTAEQQGAAVDYFLNDVVPVLDLCVKYHKVFYFNEKNTFWACHAGDEIQQIILAPQYRDVAVPSAEDSNSRAPDINAQARVGLLLTGRSSGWCCRLVADAFSFNRLWDWERVMVGHPHLRALTTQASLGAKHFMLNCAQRDDDAKPNEILDAGVAQFLHLLGKGIIAPPKPEQMKNLSPVVVNILQPSKRFLATGTGGHDWKTGAIAEGDLVFGRLENWWGMAPTGENDLARLLWGRERQFGNQIPNIGRDGCGLVTLVPGRAEKELTSYPWWNTVWRTDGDAFLNGDSVADGGKKILADMRRSAAKLPFRVEGDVYWQLILQDENTYHLYLIDPGYVYPELRTAQVIAQLPGSWTARDRITGNTLGTVAETISVEVPAGLLRLLELTREGER